MVVELLRDFRRSISPEIEYSSGVFALITTAMAVSHSPLIPIEIIPQNVQTASADTLLFGMVVASGLYLPLVIDGAFRIVMERLPWIKAFIKVYGSSILDR